MASITVKGIIDAPASEVWESIRAFVGIEKYVPAIASSTMEGSGVGARRVLQLPDGGQVIQRLEALDDQARLLRYSILESPIPFKDHFSVMRVQDLGDGQCEVEWSGSFEPVGGVPEADTAHSIEGMYMLGLEGLRKLHSR